MSDMRPHWEMCERMRQNALKRGGEKLRYCGIAILELCSADFKDSAEIFRHYEEAEKAIKDMYHTLEIYKG